MYEQVVVVAGSSPSEWPNLETYIGSATYWIGVDRGALYLKERHLPLNLALGDFDSITQAELTQVKNYAERMLYAHPEKDFTDTELGVIEALKIAKDIPIIMIGVTGGRIDHLLANLWLPFHMELKEETSRLQIIDQQNSCQYYLPGKYTLEKEVDKPYLAFICLTPIKHLTLENVKYPLDKKEVVYPTSFASNEFITNEAHFSFESGVIVVVQSKDKRKSC